MADTQGNLGALTTPNTDGALTRERGSLGPRLWSRITLMSLRFIADSTGSLPERQAACGPGTGSTALRPRGDDEVRRFQDATLRTRSMATWPVCDRVA